MSYTCFDVDISDQVAPVRMIRPEKRNSMNPAFWEELPTSRWFAYSSNEPGGTNSFEIFVQAYPGLGEKVQISTDSGRWPRWAPDGSELYYRNGTKMMAVSVETEPEFTAGVPEIIFEGSYFAPVADGRNYDISHDGQRFLMIMRDNVAEYDK